MKRTYLIAAAVAAAFAWTAPAQAHCDTLDGPVVSAGRQALETGNLKLALPWVKHDSEAELRAAFDKARAVRKAGGESKELADRYFFETLVRVHRAGEGAAFTGLKPAGHIELPVAEADKALVTGKLQPVAKLVKERVEQGLHKQYDTVMAKKNYRPDDVEAGRAYVAAYVEYVHYVEKLYDAAGAAAPAHHAH